MKDLRKRPCKHIHNENPGKALPLYANDMRQTAALTRAERLTIVAAKKHTMQTQCLHCLHVNFNLTEPGLMGLKDWQLANYCTTCTVAAGSIYMDQC